MTLTARSISTPEHQPVPATTTTRSWKAVSARTLALPLLALILILGLLALAAGGVIATTRSTDRSAFLSPVTVRHASVNGAELAGLLVRGQPMRWSESETRAVQEKAAGQHYDPYEYRAAMKAAQYNQKNGWTDNGEQRAGQGTPLRNNQKREGNNASCLQSFPSTASVPLTASVSLTASVCGEGDEDLGGGEGENPFGGIEFEEP
jgi:hypothetical protein